TGHYRMPTLIAMADMVSEIRKVKHPYDKGILAKQGIDF
ncbi:cob(I)yrinic acid a,c-diamide adenosyltransferase, partial [Candidatus Berkelbacteria bacterium]|nr:cob(I)yrinic acid a,c-diamide adenosyltransferase [Candidatus Berkelbacteria bacterium]